MYIHTHSATKILGVLCQVVVLQGVFLQVHEASLPTVDGPCLAINFLEGPETLNPKP